jgi:hypothetical protein
MPIVEIEIRSRLLILSVKSPATRLDRMSGILKYKPLTFPNYVESVMMLFMENLGSVVGYWKAGTRIPRSH